VAVLGSPHENGASATAAQRALQEARDAGHRVVEYEINKLNLRGCQACGTCKRDLVGCIQEDDVRPSWKDLHESGTLLVAAPVYAGIINGR